jgi:hypothetical protein
MDNFLGTEEMNDACEEMTHTGMMDRGFIVKFYIVHNVHCQ